MSLSGVLARHGVPAGSKGDWATPPALGSQAPRPTKAGYKAVAPCHFEVIPGLADWLELLSLAAYLPEVEKWAEHMGAVSLDEVVENLDELTTAVPFKRLESKRLARHGLEAVEMLLAGEQEQKVQEEQQQKKQRQLPQGRGIRSCLNDVEPVPVSSPADDIWNAPAPSAEEASCRSVHRQPMLLLGGQSNANAGAAAETRPTPKAITSRGAPRPAPASLKALQAASSRSAEHQPPVASDAMDDEGDDAAWQWAPPKNTGEAAAPCSGATQATSESCAAEEAKRRKGPRQWPPAATGSTTARESFYFHKEEEPSSSAIEDDRASAVRQQRPSSMRRWNGQPVGGADTRAPHAACHASERGGAIGGTDSRAKNAHSNVASAMQAGSKARPKDSQENSEMQGNLPSESTANAKARGGNGADSQTGGAARSQGNSTSSSSSALPLNKRPFTKEVVQEKRMERLRQRQGFVSVTLHVDPQSGAGLELVWYPREGFQVSKIDQWPGQPDLRVGDLITAINGVKLDAATEDEGQERFGAEFRDGADLEVRRGPRGGQSSSNGQDGREGGGAVSTGDAVTVFEVTLRVAAGAGAGLDLIWFPPEGYLVESMDSDPGQPELRPGDVLRSVGGVGLGGFQTEAQAEDALKTVLRNGAVACIYRPRSHSCNGDLVAISTSSSSTAKSSKDTLSMLLPSLGIGTWSWGHDSWGHGSWAFPPSVSAEASYSEAFLGAIGRGAFLFDSAPTYGRGQAQALLGRLREDGHYALIATKFYPRDNTRDLAGAMLASARSSVAQLCPSGKGPLDLFQLHKPASPPTTLEAQADALAAVVQAGLARAVGVCNFSLEELKVVRDRLQSTHGLPLSTCQVELSLARQLPVASGMVAACRSMGVVILAYSPLAMGRLSGKYDPRKPRNRPSWGPRGDQVRPFGAALDEDPAALGALLDALAAMGQRYGGRTMAQVALNWVIAQGAIALAGARTRQQAEENAGAMGWRLSPADVRELTTLGARGVASDFQHG